jgi:starvation-inducible DNA-binding protein
MPTTTTRKESSHTAGRGNGKGAGRPSPPPRELATVTDLEPKDVQAVTEAINPIVADALALYIKTKSFHWHLAGPRFRDLHMLFDEIADALFAAIDPLAERVRKIGGCTVRSVGHVSQLQTIGDDNDAFVPAREMCRRLMNDLRQVGENQRAAIETCETHRDSVTANVLQEILDQTERYRWFLFETIQEDADGD